MVLRKIGLLPQIGVAIVLGVLLGLVVPDWFVRIFVTFNGLFGNFLSFIIPLIIGVNAAARGAGTSAPLAVLLAGVGVFALGWIVAQYAKRIHAAGALYDYAAASPAVLERTGAIDAICRRHAVPLRAAALQFPLQHPAVATVIPGARNTEQARANAAAMQVVLDQGLDDGVHELYDRYFREAVHGRW